MVDSSLCPGMYQCRAVRLYAEAADILNHGPSLARFALASRLYCPAASRARTVSSPMCGHRQMPRPTRSCPSCYSSKAEVRFSHFHDVLIASSSLSPGMVSCRLTIFHRCRLHHEQQCQLERHLSGPCLKPQHGLRELQLSSRPVRVSCR